MIVQACLNGTRPFDFHPALPVTIEAMVPDNVKYVKAGTSELQFQPRNAVLVAEALKIFRHE